MKPIGAKYIGRRICLWGGGAKFLDDFERASTYLLGVDRVQPVSEGALR